MARLWALPLGVDFAQGFVAGLVARHPDPLDLARVTVLANSARMRRRIRQALLDRGRRLLPRLGLVADLDQHLILADLPGAAPALRRRLQVNQLVRALLSHAPDLAPASAIQGLTETLLALMEEMDAEGVAPDRLAALDVSTHAAHWERAQTFLRILLPFYATLASRGAGARRRLAALRLAELWQARPPTDPVIVAGSTASRGDIALLMEAVARLPRGAVVLPGMDFDMPPSAWASLGDPLTGEDHPQFRFLALASRLGLTPAQIAPWADLAPPAPARNRLMSLALRPAPVTDGWLAEGAALRDLPTALAGLTLIEAPSPREEALAVALVLRDGVHRGLSTALITPDRVLARRVTDALDRWGLAPDDAAGRPLVLSAPGRFLRLVAGILAQPPTAAGLIVLLKHPLTMSGQGRGAHLLLTREFELQLRRAGPPFPAGPDLLALATRHPDLPEATAWAGRLAALLDRLPPPGQVLPLAQWVARHRDLAEALACGLAPEGSGGLWREKAGEACQEVMAELAAEAEFGAAMQASEYADLFAALLAERPVAADKPSHGQVAILGAREARECGAELVVLAGLNEGVWPARPAPDPWLNRAMRHQAGLLLPERQIGLSAHDFQQGSAAPQVVLSRARRSDDAECVAARWISRLTNLVGGLPDAQGPQALAEMRQRGERWLRLARQLDRPGAAESADPGLRPAPRPKVIPPLASRPRAISITEVERLLRDPYAVYARRVLRLEPLPPLTLAADHRLKGILIHAVLDRLVKQRPPGETLAAAAARLMATLSAVFAEKLPYPLERLMWTAQVQALVPEILAEDRARPFCLGSELWGEIALPELDLRLHGRLDRVDRDASGNLVLVDYKTGKPPTGKQQDRFAWQLRLGAAMAERGAFGLPLGMAVSETRYVSLNRQFAVQSQELSPGTTETVWADFLALMRHYRRADSGYTAGRAPESTRDRGDYDHLARLGEWGLSDPPLPLTVGGGDAR